MTCLQNYLDNNQKKSTSAIAYLAALDHLKETCRPVYSSIIQELTDQRSQLKLIASENYSSLAVQLAMGNLLTDKYSEGIPDRRFYAGCENVDAIESYAIEKAKKIFNADHAYVQPHSGADANMVALFAILTHRVQDEELQKMGKTIDQLSTEEYEALRKQFMGQKLMGMSLASGGHLTHGYRHNVSSKIMHSVCYDVDAKTGLLDYKQLADQVKQEKPLILIAGYSAYPRLLDFSIMREIADSVGATLMVDMAHFAGLVAGKALQGKYDPIPYAHVVTSTTHKTLRGPRGGLILCSKEYKEVVDKGCPMVLGGPMPHVMAAKGVAFTEADTPDFQTYAKKIIKNSQKLADTFLKLGVEVVTGGTDNHLLLINVSKSFGITGRQAERALREARITVNRNAVPRDHEGPWYTSGIRLGTAAMTTLGMEEQEMQRIANIIYTLLKNTKKATNPKTKKPSRANVVIDEKVLQECKDKVYELLIDFPLYPEIVVS
jgi:glycine hydroxymethyltransferase